MGGALDFDPAREEAELRSYLGDAFDRSVLESSHVHLEREFAEAGDEERFYRISEGYLYNLTSFAMTGTKVPYLERLAAHVPPGARILDYGCGIGSDGLMLLEAGYRVEFADFDNPSTHYLRWRLERRGLESEVHDLDRGVPGGFDAAYSFDVIEHVADPFAFLDELEGRARTVCVNFLEPVLGETELHHDLPVNDLLARAARHRLRDYAILHGRSHLAIYDSRRAGPLRRLASRARIFSARAKRRLR